MLANSLRHNKSDKLYSISSARVDSIVDFMTGTIGDEIIKVYSDCIPCDGLSKRDKLRYIVCCNPTLFKHSKIVFVSCLMLGISTDLDTNEATGLHSVYKILKDTYPELLDSFVIKYKARTELPEFMCNNDYAYALSGLSYLRSQNKKDDDLTYIEDYVAGMSEFIKEDNELHAGYLGDGQNYI